MTEVHPDAAAGLQEELLDQFRAQLKEEGILPPHTGAQLCSAAVGTSFAGHKRLTTALAVQTSSGCGASSGLGSTI